MGTYSVAELVDEPFFHGRVAIACCDAVIGGDGPAAMLRLLQGVVDVAHEAVGQVLGVLVLAVDLHLDLLDVAEQVEELRGLRSQQSEVLSRFGDESQVQGDELHLLVVAAVFALDEQGVGGRKGTRAMEQSADRSLIRKDVLEAEDANLEEVVDAQVVSAILEAHEQDVRRVIRVLFRWMENGIHRSLGAESFIPRQTD